jgi:hypothetical protein
VRFSLSILGTEVVAVQFGAEPEPDVRYDPTSTTACQAETAYQSVRSGLDVDTNPSLTPVFGLTSPRDREIR